MFSGDGDNEVNGGGDTRPIFHTYEDRRFKDGMWQAFYIGKGTDKRVDREQRRNKYHANICRKYQWKRVVVFSGTESEVIAEEIRLIAFYGRKDLELGPLCNLTNGGDGTSGWVAGEETKAKMSAANTGKTLTDETRAKISANNGARQPEARAKMSASRTGKTGEKNPMFGRTHTDETKAKISAANTGKTRTDETRAKMSAANTGKTRTDETRAKMSAANTGKKHTKETKAKISSETSLQKEIAAYYGIGFNEVTKAVKTRYLEEVAGKENGGR